MKDELSSSRIGKKQLCCYFVMTAWLSNLLHGFSTSFDTFSQNNRVSMYEISTFRLTRPRCEQCQLWWTREASTFELCHGHPGFRLMF